MVLRAGGWERREISPLRLRAPVEMTILTSYELPQSLTARVETFVIPTEVEESLSDSFRSGGEGRGFASEWPGAERDFSTPPAGSGRNDRGVWVPVEMTAECGLRTDLV